MLILKILFNLVFINYKIWLDKWGRLKTNKNSKKNLRDQKKTMTHTRPKSMTMKTKILKKMVFFSLILRLEI